MEVIKTEIEGVVIIEPRLFKDERGYFFSSLKLILKVGNLSFV
jgi:dTDP-4-dehydrorhamnose 3,5-epimerase